MKVIFEFNTEYSSDREKLNTIYSILNEDYTESISVIDDKNNNCDKEDNDSEEIFNTSNTSWNWVTTHWKQKKTKQRVIDIINIVATCPMGCRSIENRLSGEVGYQTIRNHLLKLVEVGALLKVGNSYSLSDKARDTVSLCLK